MSSPEQRLKWRQTKQQQAEQRKALLKEVEEQEKRIAEEEKAQGVPKYLADLRWGHRMTGVPVKGDASQETCREWYRRDPAEFLNNWSKREAEWEKRQAEARAQDDPGGLQPSIELAIAWLEDYQRQNP
jgi:hypothetical protein